MNRAITNALRASKARTITVDVTFDGTTLKLQDRGNPYARFYFPHELTAGEQFVAEGLAYNHIYLCDASVPANIKSILEA